MIWRVRARDVWRIWRLLIALSVITIGLPDSARADEYDLFVRAKNAYEAGEYKEAVSRFEELLERGLSNSALALECNKLLAVSYMFTDDRDAAELYFTKLLTISPNYRLDPMLFPIEVVDFFTEIKQKNEERLEALARARAEEDARQKVAEEAHRKAELEKLKRNVYLEREVKQNSLLVALMPFGAGQFQNGHTVKGALFLSGEILLTGATITTYFLHADLRKDAKEPFDSTERREEAERLEAGYRIANQASLVGLSVLAVTGIIDALYNFERETVTWKSVPEREVPSKLRPGGSKPAASLAPRLGRGMVGLEFIGRF